MGTLLTRRNILIALSLILLLLLLYPSLQLVQKQQKLKSRAQEPQCPVIKEYDQCGGTCYAYKEGEEQEFDDHETVHVWQFDTSDSQCSREFECERRGRIEGQCGNSITPPPPASSVGVGPSISPAICNIDSKQNPSVGEACASCIVNSNGGSEGIIRSIRGVCPNTNQGKSDLQMINFWCNGGISGAQANCEVKKRACGKACGFPDISPSPSPLTSPSTKPAKPTNLNATCNGNQATISWTTPSSDTFSYDVRVDGPAGFSKKDCGPSNVCVRHDQKSITVSLDDPKAQFSAWVHTVDQKSGNVSEPSDILKFSCKNSNTVSPSISPSPSSLTCDFNKDGNFDDKDFKIWVDEFTGQKRTRKADCNGDLRVDLLDFNMWRDQKLEREE